MSEFPLPSGKPVAYAFLGDPWAEQARRHERHRREQRRQRRRILLGVAGGAVVVAVASVAAIFLVGIDNSSDSAADASRVGTGSTIATARSGPVETATATTSATAATSNGGVGEQAAKVVDVWLLDRGDGSFDWGAVLASNADTVRGNLELSVAASDDDGVEVFAEVVAVPRLAPNGRAAVGGVFDAEGETPTRVEVTATLGAALPDEAGVVFAVSDVRRVASGQVDRDDRLLGTVEMIAGSGVPVRLAALWRDDEGRVVAAVFDVLGPVDVAAGVEFSLRLPRNLVPPGEPDTIVASVGATDEMGITTAGSAT